jgi:beta-lactamase superfamily II metal-dependent hydrolase
MMGKWYAQAAWAATLAVTATLALTVMVATAVRADDAAQRALNVYFIDVEGGQATLFVTPSGESLLIDTGWADSAKLIAATVRQAGLQRIDYVVITHYHEDHVGGAAALARELPIGTFIDHGENREPPTPAREPLLRAYRDMLQEGRQQHRIVHVGDELELHDLKIKIVAADGAVLPQPLPPQPTKSGLAGAGAPNLACGHTEQRPEDLTENGRSLGMLLVFGGMRFLDLGDLTWDRERSLMCPVNRIGDVQVYVVSHHGWRESGSPALVEGIHPRVAIMDNGATKGGSPPVWDILHHAPTLEDLWQLHYSVEGGAAHNSPAPLIANLDGPDAHYFLRLTAWPDGHFEVFNSRTGQTKHYGLKR